jgi:hypothetical protein
MFRFLKKLTEVLNTCIPQKTEPLNISFKANSNEIKRISKDYFDVYSTLPILKEKYKTDCENAEDFIQNYEMIKNTLQVNENAAYEENIYRKLQAAKESEISYSKIVNSINSEQDKFLTQTNSLLKKMQNYDKEISFMFQHSLQKLQVFLINKNEEETKEFQKETNIINQLSSLSLENKDFHFNKQSKQIEFEPYVLKVLIENEKLKAPKELETRINSSIQLYNVISKMKSQLQTVAHKVIQNIFIIFIIV